jgi:hypothetical protein
MAKQNPRAGDLFSAMMFFFVMATIAASLSGISARAEEVSPFSGRLYTDQYFYTQGPQSGNPEQSSLSAWLAYTNQFDQGTWNGWGVKAIGQLDYFDKSLDGEKNNTVETHLREGYVSYVTNGSDLRVGQQIIPWGKSDGVNPTDYFTAKDYTILNPDDEVRRFGAPGVNFSFTPDSGNSPFTFQFVGQAFYPQTKLLIPDQVIPASVRFQKYATAPDPFTAGAMEFGIKASYLKSNYDFSLSFYQGYAHMPEYIFNPRNSQIYPINPQETAVGGDGSFTYGDYIIRLETALHLPQYGTAQDPNFGLVQPDHWDSVVGVERPVFTDFRIQVQALYRYQLYYRDPSTYQNANPTLQAIQQTVGRANTLILNYLEQSNLGATFRFGYANEASDWGADIFLIGYFTSNDFLFRPQVSYKVREGLKLMLGADLYGGSPGQTFGALKDDSDVFFEAKYLF